MTEPKDYICKNCRSKLYGKLEKCPLCNGELVVFKGKEPKNMSDNTPNRTLAGRLKKVIGTCLELIAVALAVLGFFYLAMIITEPMYFSIPFTAIENVMYTRMANEYHSEVQTIADNITKACKEQTPDIENCQIMSARDFMLDNFKYARDYTTGYSDRGFNMILENTTLGDCEDWSITLCSLLRHMGIPCIIRSPSFDHTITVIKRGNSWYTVEPQNHGNGLDDDIFRGFLI